MLRVVYYSTQIYGLACDPSIAARLPVSDIFQIIRDVLRHVLGVILEAIGIHDFPSSACNERTKLSRRCNDSKSIQSSPRNVSGVGAVSVVALAYQYALPIVVRMPHARRSYFPFSFFHHRL